MIKDRKNKKKKDEKRQKENERQRKHEKESQEREYIMLRCEKLGTPEACPPLN